MKQPKKLTREQKECLSAHYLNCKDWMLVEETDFYYRIINKNRRRGRNSMKYVIGIIIGIVCLAGVIALKAISASTTYMDDSFRWGGRDGY